MGTRTGSPRPVRSPALRPLVRLAIALMRLDAWLSGGHLEVGEATMRPAFDPYDPENRRN
jgi:hypothetical protein